MEYKEITTVGSASHLSENTTVFVNDNGTFKQAPLTLLGSLYLVKISAEPGEPGKADRTYAEVVEAIESGKTVLMVYMDGNVYPYMGMQNNRPTFNAGVKITDGKAQNATIQITEDERVVQNASAYFKAVNPESLTIKQGGTSKTYDGSSSVTAEIPDVLIVKMGGGNVSSHTQQEVKNAYNEGKAILLVDPIGHVYTMTGITEGVPVFHNTGIVPVSSEKPGYDAILIYEAKLEEDGTFSWTSPNYSTTPNPYALTITTNGDKTEYDGSSAVNIDLDAIADVGGGGLYLISVVSGGKANRTQAEVLAALRDGKTCVLTDGSHKVYTYYGTTDYWGDASEVNCPTFVRYERMESGIAQYEARVLSTGTVVIGYQNGVAKTPNPKSLFIGDKSYDGSQQVNVELPVSLPNPFELTIGDKTYDGSEAVTIQDVLYVVTAIPSGTGWISDRSREEIDAAVEAGKACLMHFPDIGDVMVHRGNYKFASNMYLNNVSTPGLYFDWAEVNDDKTIDRYGGGPLMTANPSKLTFTGAVNATYDGSVPVKVEVPVVVPDVLVIRADLANPNIADHTPDEIRAAVADGKVCVLLGDEGRAYIYHGELPDPIQFEERALAFYAPIDYHNEEHHTLVGRCAYVRNDGTIAETTTPNVKAVNPSKLNITVDGKTISYDGEYVKDINIPAIPEVANKLLVVSVSSVDGKRMSDHTAQEIKNAASNGKVCLMVVEGKTLCYVMNDSDGNPFFQSTYSPRTYPTKKSFGIWIDTATVLDDDTVKFGVTTPIATPNPYALTIKNGDTSIQYSGNDDVTVEMPTVPDWIEKLYIIKTSRNDADQVVADRSPDDIEVAVSSGMSPLLLNGAHGMWFIGFESHPQTGELAPAFLGDSTYSEQYGAVQFKSYISSDQIVVNTGEYVKIPNPQKLTFTGAVNVTYDGSSAVTVNIPTGGGGDGGNIPDPGVPNQQLVSNAEGKAVWQDIPEPVQSDWDQMDENAPDYVKNRTHYDVVRYEFPEGMELPDSNTRVRLTNTETFTTGYYDLVKVSDIVPTVVDVMRSGAVGGTGGWYDVPVVIINETEYGFAVSLQNDGNVHAVICNKPGYTAEWKINWKHTATIDEPGVYVVERSTNLGVSHGGFAWGGFAKELEDKFIPVNIVREEQLNNKLGEFEESIIPEVSALIGAITNVKLAQFGKKVNLPETTVTMQGDEIMAFLTTPLAEPIIAYRLYDVIINGEMGRTVATPVPPDNNMPEGTLMLALSSEAGIVVLPDEVASTAGIYALITTPGVDGDFTVSIVDAGTPGYYFYDGTKTTMVSLGELKRALESVGAPTPILTGAIVELDLDAGPGFIATQPTSMPVVDSVYTVTYNGVPYDCPALPYAEDGMYMGVMLGNTAEMGVPGGNPNAPFLIMFAYEPTEMDGVMAYGVVIDMTGESVVTLSVVGTGGNTTAILAEETLINGGDDDGDGKDDTFITMTPLSVIPEAGKTYAATFNGTAYNVQAHNLDNDGVIYGVVMGNLYYLADGNADTGEPFLLMIPVLPEFSAQMGGATLGCVVPDGAESVVLSITGEGSAPSKSARQITIIIDDDGNVTSDIPFETAWAMTPGELQAAIMIKESSNYKGTTSTTVETVSKVEGALGGALASHIHLRIRKGFVDNSDMGDRDNTRFLSWAPGNTFGLSNIELNALPIMPHNSAYAGYYLRYDGRSWAPVSIDQLKADLGLT